MDTWTSNRAKLVARGIRSVSSFIYRRVSCENRNVQEPRKGKTRARTQTYSSIKIGYPNCAPAEAERAKPARYPSRERDDSLKSPRRKTRRRNYALDEGGRRRKEEDFFQSTLRR